MLPITVMSYVHLGMSNKHLKQDLFKDLEKGEKYHVLLYYLDNFHKTTLSQTLLKTSFRKDQNVV